MFKNILIFIVAFLFGLNSIKSQEELGWYRYNWNEVSKNDYLNFAEQIKTFVADEYKEDIYIGAHLSNYSYFISSALDYDISQGAVYPRFAYDFENYIHRILTALLKDTLQVKKIKVYLSYDPEFNATMDGGCNMRINSGIFNYINSEAELAAILAHEWGHFIGKDNNKLYSSQKNYEPGRSAWYSREQEATADLIAIELLDKSNYSLSGMEMVLKTIRRIDIKTQILNNGKPVIWNSHPNPAERIKGISQLSNGSFKDSKKMFFIDSVKFSEIQKLIAKESINSLFEKMDFNSIIELSFRKYLFDPTDKGNLYVLLESIRRLISKYPDITKKQFIIYKYKGKGVSESKNYRYINDNGSSILNYLSKGLLHISSSDIKKIKAKDLCDSVKTEFVTYQEAFNYFAEKAKILNCSSCLLIEQLYKSSLGIGSEYDSIYKLISEKVEEKYKVSGKDLFIALNPYLPQSSFDFNDLNDYSVLNKEYRKIFKEKMGTNCFMIDEMPFGDQKLFNSAFLIVSDVLKISKETYLPEKMFLDWTKYFPEIIKLFKKYNVQNIYIVKFQYEHKHLQKEIYGPHGAAKIYTPASWSYLTRISLPAEKEKNISAQYIKLFSHDIFKEHVENSASKWLFFTKKAK